MRKIFSGAAGAVVGKLGVVTHGTYCQHKRVCVKRTGKRRAKLDRFNFTGIFLGYTASDQNIRYIDLNTGIVKQSHHAVFDEAWYLQPSRPPAAQLLYDLGLVDESDITPAQSTILSPTDVPPAPYPPMNALPSTKLPTNAKLSHLPLRMASYSDVVNENYTAAAATVSIPDPYKDTILESNKDAQAVDEFGISKRDIEQVYFSPHPYKAAFEDELDLRRYRPQHNATAGLTLEERHGRLILTNMEPRAHLLLKSHAGEVGSDTHGYARSMMLRCQPLRTLLLFFKISPHVVNRCAPWSSLIPPLSMVLPTQASLKSTLINLTLASHSTTSSCRNFLQHPQFLM